LRNFMTAAAIEADKRGDSMKRRNQLVSEKLSKVIVGAKLALALLALVALCVCATAQENAAEGWYKKGLELELSDSREEAVQAYDKAIQLDPQNPKYWNNKAFNLWLLHRNQEANQASEKALGLYNDTLQENPKDIDSWMGKAQVFNNLAWADIAGTREAYREAALYSYDQVLQIDPKNASALSLKGGALFELGRHAEAIEAIDRALKIGFPPSQEWMAEGTLQIKGLALAALGKENESEKSYQETLKGFDEDIEKADTSENLSQAWLSKGFILQEQDKYEQSIKALDNATDANPKNEMAWRVKGFMLANWLGRYQEGLAALDKALDINPSADVWEAKARVFNELGRYDEALEASDNALMLNKNLTRTWLVKGHALRGLGKHQEALDAYAQAENTYDEQLWGGRGFSLARLNRSDEAAEAFNKSLSASQKVLDKDNKSAYAWFWKGEALRGLGRYQESLEAYDRSLEIGPEKAISAWMGKGDVLKTLGRQADADAAFAKAKELGYLG
jgi:tetratricopeptide (TPR) repeat protein